MTSWSGRARGGAAARIDDSIHRMNSERYVGDSKLHEMVEIAMEESWEVCMAHMQPITESIAAVIAQGVASGEFEARDVPLAAMCACTAMMRFFHPQMIAQAMNKPGPSIDQMVDFVLAGLAALRLSLVRHRERQRSNPIGAGCRMDCFAYARNDGTKEDT